MAERHRARGGFWRAVAVVAGKDLRIEGRSFEQLSAMLVFALILLVISSFAFDLATVRKLGSEKMVPGLLWLTFAFSGIIGFTRSFQIEREGGALFALMLSPVDRGAIYLGKTIANVVTLWIMQLLVTALSAVFFDWDLFAVALPVLTVVGWHGVGLVALGTLFAALATRVGRGEALLGTLLLPASTPLFLSAVRCTEAAIGGEPLAGVAKWLGLVTGLNLLYLLISLLTFDFLLEE